MCFAERKGAWSGVLLRKAVILQVLASVLTASPRLEYQPCEEGNLSSWPAACVCVGWGVGGGAGWEGAEQEPKKRGGRAAFRASSFKRTERKSWWKVLTKAAPPGCGVTNSQVLLSCSLALHWSGRARWLPGAARHGWAI